MKLETKKEIAALLEVHISRFDNQHQASKALKGISEAYIIAIRKGHDCPDWDKIADKMWLNLGKQLGWAPNKDRWNLVETEDFNTLLTMFADAADYHNVLAVIGRAGTGKTTTARYFAENRRNVYHLECAEFWTQRYFLTLLAGKMGIDTRGMSVADIMESIQAHVLRTEAPLIILDEADKLKDSVLYFFITLYNQLQGRCGIVLLATKYLAVRVGYGVKYNRKGFEEIFSRVGRRFIELNGTNLTEVREICAVNGIDNLVEQTHIYNECSEDLRGVERGVHKFKMLALHAKAS